MTPSLATRLAVYACKDLAKSAPKTYNALTNWLQHSGFWLAELSTCPKRHDQVSCMIGFLGLSLSRENQDIPLQQACKSLYEHMTLHQMTRQA